MAAGIGNGVRRLRFETGEMTQHELARRVGVTRQTILAIEAGRHVPSLALAFRIARVFGRRVDEVFTYEEPGGDPGAEQTAAEPSLDRGPQPGTMTP